MFWPILYGLMGNILPNKTPNDPIVGVTSKSGLLGKNWCLIRESVCRSRKCYFPGFAFPGLNKILPPKRCLSIELSRSDL